MIADEIIARLESDYTFGLNFAVDNNLNGVLQALAVNGYTGGTSRAFAYTTLKTLFEKGETQKLVDILTSVRYMNNVDNYTGGLSDYFLRTSPPSSYPIQNPDERTMFEGVLAGLGAGLTTFFAATAQPTQTQISMNTYLSEADKAEIRRREEEAKKKKTWVIVGVIAGTLILIGVLVFAMRSKK